MARVLLLREASAARATAADLERLGHRPAILPLEETRFLAAGPPAGPYDGIALTSARAVPALRAIGFPSKACERPVFSVGEATAQAVREAGFATCQGGENDAASLAATIAAFFGGTGTGEGRPRLLYLAGRRRTGSLEEALARAGIACDIREVYDVVPRLPTRGEVDAVLGPHGMAGLDRVLVLSVGQAEAFAGLVARFPGLVGTRTRLHVLSARIAEALPADLRRRTRISLAKTMTALFESLDDPISP